MAPELVVAIALAVLGSAAWPFAPHALPLHFGLGGYGNFASSWVLLIAIPWFCAAVAAYLANRERPNLRQAAYTPVVVSLTALLLALTFVAL